MYFFLFVLCWNDKIMFLFYLIYSCNVWIDIKIVCIQLTRQFNVVFIERFWEQCIECNLTKGFQSHSMKELKVKNHLYEMMNYNEKNLFSLKKFSLDNTSLLPLFFLFFPLVLTHRFAFQYDISRAFCNYCNEPSVTNFLRWFSCFWELVFLFSFVISLFCCVRV